MKKAIYYFSCIPFLAILFLISQCTDDQPIPIDNDTDNEDTTTNPPPPFYNFSGYVQKGPFVNGSSITIYDLKGNLSPSGKSFNTQIKDNKGSFELNDLSLNSGIITIRADGFYYNEVSGKNSTAQLSLYAISDISGKARVNVNLLTHLEKPRVEYLVKNGQKFADAKKQAQQEVLAVFNLTKTDTQLSECLDISESGPDNGMLLAMSAILQGFRTESELTELLSEISEDIRSDGELNSASLGSALVNHALMLDTIEILSNMTERYTILGDTASPNGFSRYIADFIENTSFIPTTNPINYPLTGQNGRNILAISDTVFTGRDFSFAADLPVNAYLKIKLSALGGDTTIIPADDSTSEIINIQMGLWYYSYSSGKNWSITDFDMVNYTQFFTANESGKSCDLSMAFDKGRFLLEYYEKDAITLTRRKVITVK
jgi:hypothetical protein